MNETFEFHMTGARSDEPSTAIPAARFAHPDDVLGDRTLGQAEKRVILADWLSDARAVENSPAWRQLDSGAVVSVDEILRALRALDASRHIAESTKTKILAFPQPRRSFRRWLRKTVRFNSFDDHDDPPPSPAYAAGPMRPQFVKADGRTDMQLRA